MADTADRPGVAHLVLAPGVAHLVPETAVFGAMLDGWAMQQGARFLQPATIEQRRALLRRLAEFTNDYPWNWQCPDLEEFIASCRPDHTAGVGGARPSARASRRSNLR